MNLRDKIAMKTYMKKYDELCEDRKRIVRTLEQTGIVPK